MSKVLLREIMSLVDKNSTLIPEEDCISMYQPPMRILIIDPSDEDDDMVEMGSPVAGVSD